jgi:hypothetical protein
MKLSSFFILAAFTINSIADDKIPSKSEFDAVMQNAVKQMNAQMAGTKVDEYTTLKFVTYDLNPPLFSYFYTSTTLTVLKQDNLNQMQTDAIKKFNTTKTCSTRFKPLMKPYNFKVAHIFEDKNSGKIIYKLTVSHLDC